MGTRGTGEQTREHQKGAPRPSIPERTRQSVCAYDLVLLLSARTSIRTSTPNSSQWGRAGWLPPAGKSCEWVAFVGEAAPARAKCLPCCQGL